MQRVRLDLHSLLYIRGASDVLPYDVCYIPGSRISILHLQFLLDASKRNFFLPNESDSQLVLCLNAGKRYQLFLHELDRLVHIDLTGISHQAHRRQNLSQSGMRSFGRFVGPI